VTASPPPRAGIIVGSGAWHVLRRAGGFDLGDGSPHETPFGRSRPVFEAALPGGRQVWASTWSWRPARAGASTQGSRSAISSCPAT